MARLMADRGVQVNAISAVAASPEKAPLFSAKAATGEESLAINSTLTMIGKGAHASSDLDVEPNFDLLARCLLSTHSMPPRKGGIFCRRRVRPLESVALALNYRVEERRAHSPGPAQPAPPDVRRQFPKRVAIGWPGRTKISMPWGVWARISSAGCPAPCSPKTATGEPPSLKTDFCAPRAKGSSSRWRSAMRPTVAPPNATKSSPLRCCVSSTFTCRSLRT